MPSISVINTTTKSISVIRRQTVPMIGKNRQLIMDEPVEFEK